MERTTYEPGALVIVKYGRAGSQLGRVEGMTRTGFYLVRKWLKNGRSWTTHPCRVPSTEIRGRATDAQVRHYRPALGGEGR
jgi:hypothetical protein